MIGKQLYPDISGLEHILHHLNNLGWCSSNGMGLTSLSFLEVQAYIELTDTALSADEVLIIKRMSQAYVNELQDKDTMKKSPYGNQSIHSHSNNFASILKAAANKA